MAGRLKTIGKLVRVIAVEITFPQFACLPFVRALKHAQRVEKQTN